MLCYPVGMWAHASECPLVQVVSPECAAKCVCVCESRPPPGHWVLCCAKASPPGNTKERSSLARLKTSETGLLVPRARGAQIQSLDSSEDGQLPLSCAGGSSPFCCFVQVNPNLLLGFPKLCSFSQISWFSSICSRKWTFVPSYPYMRAPGGTV